jgi:hypothetical protein
MATKFRIAYARVQANGRLPEELSNIDRGNQEKKEIDVSCYRALILILRATTEHSCSYSELLQSIR